jgi:putative transposase
LVIVEQSEGQVVTPIDLSTNPGQPHIEPGSLWQNGFAESLNSRFRDEFLNTQLFATVAEAQALADRCRWE